MKILASALTAVSAMFVLSACTGAQSTWNDFLEYADYQYEHGTAYSSDADLIVYFDFDMDDITSEAAKSIDTFAASVAGNDSVGVVITGHTDTSGDPTYNKDLSERRAEAVRDALMSAGVEYDNTRVDIYGDGETNPAVKTGDGVPEQANRRVTVEAVIIGGSNW